MASASNFKDVSILGYNLSINRVEFELRRIHARVTLTARVAPTATTIVLDACDLTTSQVMINGAEARFESGLDTLAIDLPDTVESRTDVRVDIRYTTSPSAPVLQWIPKEATRTRKYPFLLCSARPAGARSLMPCQDTPYVRSMFSATVTVPSGFTVLMCGNQRTTPTAAQMGYLQFKFHQPDPVPICLIGLAVGHLVSRDVGEKVRIWSEPPLLDAAAAEFSDVADMVSTCASLCGEFPWAHMDLLVTPPSFPYGGVTHLGLAFVHPTVLVGDKSLIHVVANAVAQAWHGNSATPSTWGDQWIASGWTKFLQRTIMTTLGLPSSDCIVAGVQRLNEVIRASLSSSQMAPDIKLNGVDAAFGIVPKEKGFLLLKYLETLVGVMRFRRFTLAFSQRWAHRTVNAKEFQTMLEAEFPDVRSVHLIDWDKWMYKPGASPYTPLADYETNAAASSIAEAWVSDPSTINPSQFESSSGSQVIMVLDVLMKISQGLAIQTPPSALHPSMLERLDQVYKFGTSNNVEIRYRYFRLCLDSGMKDTVPSVLDLVATHHRLKHVRPLYRALLKVEFGRDPAIKFFNKIKNRYHSFVRAKVESDIDAARDVAPVSPSGYAFTRAISSGSTLAQPPMSPISPMMEPMSADADLGSPSAISTPPSVGSRSEAPEAKSSEMEMEVLRDEARRRLENLRLLLKPDASAADVGKGEEKVVKGTPSPTTQAKAKPTIPGPVNSRRSAFSSPGSGTAASAAKSSSYAATKPPPVQSAAGASPSPKATGSVRTAPASAQGGRASSAQRSSRKAGKDASAKKELKKKDSKKQKESKPGDDEWLVTSIAGGIVLGVVALGVLAIRRM